MTDIRALLRDSAAELVPYDPALAPVEINLSANENTRGLPPAAREAVLSAIADVSANRYPVPLADELRARLAMRAGVAPERVIVGNGGDELIFNLLLAFGGAGRTVVTAPPAFSVYKLYAELLECTVVEVPRDAETFAPDADALAEAAADAHIVFLTSPNNPTGELFPREGVEKIARAAKGIVLLDEAYIEFADEGADAADLLDAYDNLAILRTFSKAYALAGARVGYALADPRVISALAAVRQPYSVNVFSQAAALAALAHADAFAADLADIRAERERLAQALEAAGARVWPSDANFLLVRVSDAHRVWERLRDEWSILVRDFSSAPGLEGCLRVSVGTREENDKLAAAIAALV